MDKTKIAQFSDTVRDKLCQETRNRAAFYGVFPDRIQDMDGEFEDSIVKDGKVFNKTIKRQREQLVRAVREKGYEQVMDEVSYTWFNRFVAIKFMEVNCYLPVKVFSSQEAGKSEPDILTQSLNLKVLDIDRDRVITLKSEGKDEELYRYLILRLCNYLHEVMPFLFEPIEDCTELLFPDRLLHTDSILGDLNNIIDEADWREVEVIGCIYQTYIANKKEVLIKAKKKYLPSQIPTVTQLFTPKWIVKYMVQNSLGRYWLESHPDKELQNKFEYYLESRDPDYFDKIKEFADRTLNLENIKFIDPAMGSGHILVYAFEVFYEIYKASGYVDSEIPELILTKNLYGLEIDERAAQLASFDLLMKAREYDKRLFEKKIELNITSIHETNNFTDDDIKLFAGNDGDYAKIKKMFNVFKDAKTYGSIIKTDEFDSDLFERKINEFEKSQNLRKYEILDGLKAIAKQAEIMGQKYDVAVANPPYLNRSRMPDNLKKYVENNYSTTKYDLFAVFIENMTYLTKPNGHIGLMCPFVWMFIQSYEGIRKYIIENKNISSLVQLEYSAFKEATVPICTFTLRNHKNDTCGEYVRLTDFKGSENQPVKMQEAVRNQKVDYRYTTKNNDFSKIPGSPIAYWVSDMVRDVFSKFPHISENHPIKSGIMTGNDELFLKLWHEVALNDIGFGLSSASEMKAFVKWYPLSKGGDFRKWFGNNEHIINLRDNAYDIKNGGGNYRLRETDWYFKPYVTWSRISSSSIAFRIIEEGILFSDAGPGIFANEKCFNIIAFLNSKLSNHFLAGINPTLNYQARDIESLPCMNIDLGKELKALIKYGKSDWDSYENSWNFTTLPLLQFKNHHHTLRETYTKLLTHWREMTLEMQRLEEENNHIFIEAYSLHNELTPEVPLNEITLICNPWYRYGKKCEDQITGEFPEDTELEARLLTDTMKQFISYAVGCMFGRYSPDREGLILANQGETIDDFMEKVPDPSFMPDDDNIIPILEDEYFTDDIVSRFKQFLKATFGVDSLADNLDFIAGALSKSKNGTKSPEKTIRDYFLKSFFKDHVRTYKKRPIYWLFTSGKGRGFNALVYMHRYDTTTLAKMRTDYLLELESKLDARMDMLSPDSARDKQEREKLSAQIEELAAYDEVLNNKALEYIDIDLDDGVVVNYAKFEGLVGKV